MKTAREHYRELIDQMDDSEKVSAWNTAQQEHCGDGEIFSNDEEFFSTFFSDTLAAVRAVCFGNYRYQDAWVIFNGYSNLDSSNDPEEFMDLNELAEAIEQNPRAYDVEEFEEEEGEDEESEE